MVRAIRGATTVENNTRDEILNVTREMVAEIIIHNNIKIEDLISINFTLTPDLDAVFPAVAVRELGIVNVPLMDFAQPNVQNSLGKCIRTIIYFNTDKGLDEIEHLYLRGARKLRPDLIKD